MHCRLERAVAVAVQYVHQPSVAEAYGACNVLKAVAVVVCGGQRLRRIAGVVKDPEGLPERAVTVAYQNSGAVAVPKRHREVLDRVTIEVRNRDVIARGEEVTAGNEEDGRLLDEGAIAHAQ